MVVLKKIKFRGTGTTQIRLYTVKEVMCNGPKHGCMGKADRSATLNWLIQVYEALKEVAPA